jgi:hypothetical protein
MRRRDRPSCYCINHDAVLILLSVGCAATVNSSLHMMCGLWVSVVLASSQVIATDCGAFALMLCGSKFQQHWAIGAAISHVDARLRLVALAVRFFVERIVMQEPLAISRVEAARRLGISPRTVDRLNVPFVRAGRRKLFTPSGLAAWLAAQQEGEVRDAR